MVDPDVRIWPAASRSSPAPRPVSAGPRRWRSRRRRGPRARRPLAGRSATSSTRSPRSGSKPRRCAGDIGDSAVAGGWSARRSRRIGRLDVVVNNAGILRDRMLFGMSDAEWDDVVRVHLRGHFLVSRDAAAHWRDAAKAGGGPVYGRLVNTASEAWLFGSAGPGQLRGGQGGHRRADGLGRARPRALRRPRQRHLPPRPHRDDRGRLRRRRQERRIRPAVRRPRRAVRRLPGEPGGGRGSTARSSSSTAGWSRTWRRPPWHTVSTRQGTRGPRRELAASLGPYFAARRRRRLRCTTHVLPDVPGLHRPCPT